MRLRKMQPSLISANEVKLADLVRQGRFFVPRHQRYYDWEKKHVDTLLQDFAEAVDDGNPCHFLGSIMLINREEADEWEINDGQQRMITFSLVCAYLCRFFAQQGSSAEEGDILRILFQLDEAHGKSLHPDAGHLLPRIIPPRNNKVNFENLIRGHNVGTNGKMFDAWGQIRSFFEHPDHQDAVWRKKLTNFMLNDVIVIRLEVDQSLDTNAIFETLNYRGKSVEQMDLIKNYFLQSFRKDAKASRVDAVYDNLEIIYGNFGSKVGNVADYTRCVMQAEESGFINKERFLKALKNLFRGKGARREDAIYAFVGKLADKERIQAFKTFRPQEENKKFLQKLAAHAGKSNAKRKIHDHLADLQRYTVTRPVIFSLLLLYLKAPDKQKSAVAKVVCTCIKFLASFIQRSAHVANFRPALFEEKLANLARHISRGNCATAKAFFAKLQKCDKLDIIDDSRYIEQMKANFSRSSEEKFAYIVKRIVEDQERKTRLPDGDVSIEHILPRSEFHSSKPGWQNFSPDEHKRFSRALGNLTLLGRGEDSSKEADNASFSAKKKIYAKSSYKMSSELHQKFTEWTPDNVKVRQGKMARTAAKRIWNFEP